MPLLLRGKFHFLFFYLFLLCGGIASAQIDTLKPKPDSNQVAKQKDINDLIKKIFGVSLSKGQDTVLYRPGKLYLSAFPTIDYSIITGFTVLLIGDFAFYTSKGADANLSNVQTEIKYSQNNQFLPNIISNIWTKKNKFNLVGDWRYYKYSVYTYGLGGNTPTANSDHYLYSFLRVYQIVQRSIVPDLLGGIGYNLDYHWDIKDGSSTPDLNNDYYKYGFKDRTVSSGATLNLLYDKRRNLHNPVAGGSYANIIFKQNLKVLGSDENWQSLYLDFRKYISFPRDSKCILAFWQYDWLTLKGNPPYFDLPSTAWDTYLNSGRPYIQGRYRGKNLLYFETEYRFPITKNGFWAGAFFADAQSTSEWPSNTFKTLIPGVGASVRVKLNKHSDTFLIISYGVGVRGQNGFSFNLGEMF